MVSLYADFMECVLARRQLGFGHNTLPLSQSICTMWFRCSPDWVQIGDN